MSIGFNEEFDIRSLQKRLRECPMRSFSNSVGTQSICVHQTQTWDGRRVKFSLFS
jgi:hypothetical protein